MQKNCKDLFSDQQLKLKRNSCIVMTVLSCGDCTVMTVCTAMCCDDCTVFVLCRPTFQQLVAILTEIEVEFRRECHRQRPAMTVGAAANSPSSTTGRGRSVGPGGVPLPFGGQKPPSRLGSGVDPNAGSFSSATASPMLYAGASLQAEASTRASLGASRLSS